MSEQSAVTLLLASLLTVVGFMARNALSKISKLEEKMQLKVDVAKCEASVGVVYQRTDHHFELLRKDIGAMSNKFDAKLDKMSDKLTRHIENHNRS